MKTAASYCFTVLCLLLHCICNAATYYLSSTGSDSNSGLSVSTAWRSISKLNTINFQPGDVILFEAGSVFPGNLLLEAADAGTPALPILFSSYGTGRATIAAGNSYGIKAYNCAGFRFANLNIEGSGATLNNAIGIDIYMDIASNLSYLRIDSCNVSGFKVQGIQFGCWDTYAGFRDVRITNVHCFDNGGGGLASFGFNTVMNHKDVYVGNSRFYNNRGRTDVTNTNTGSGLVLSGIENALVEYCEAYNNGENNSNPSGGPVGIWFYLVKNGVIQFCESHHNRTGTADGGGFDLDGGCQQSVIQYCYSHDNAGPGFLMAEYGSGIPFTGNIIRYNISQNDARKSSAGSITFWGADGNNKILQSQVYNNSIYLNADNLQDGIPAAVKLIGNNFSGVQLSNNIFYTSGAVRFINADVQVDSSSLHFLYNDYFSATGQPSFYWAFVNYSSLNAWRVSAITQERRGLLQTGTEADPRLLAAGGGGTVGLAQLQQLPSYLAAYQLQSGSIMNDAGINMLLAGAANIGTQDFFGNPPLSGISQDIGAHECASCYAILPAPVAVLAARRLQNNAVILDWKVSAPATIKSFVAEYSINGKDFYPLRTISAAGYSFIDSSSNGGVRYYRLQVLQNNGRQTLSNIVVVAAKNDESALSMSVIPSGSDCRLLINSPVQQRISFSVINAQGQLLHTAQRVVPQGSSCQSFSIPLLRGNCFIIATGETGGRVCAAVRR